MTQVANEQHTTESVDVTCTPAYAARFSVLLGYSNLWANWNSLVSFGHSFESTVTDIEF